MTSLISLINLVGEKWAKLPNPDDDDPSLASGPVITLPEVIPNDDDSAPTKFDLTELLVDMEKYKKNPPIPTKPTSSSGSDDSDDSVTEQRHTSHTSPQHHTVMERSKDNQGNAYEARTSKGETASSSPSSAPLRPMSDFSLIQGYILYILIFETLYSYHIHIYMYLYIYI